MINVSSAPGLGPIRKKGGYWLIAGRMGQNQGNLLDNPNVDLQTTMTLNPATLLPAINSDCSLTHYCLESLNSVYCSRPNQSNLPLVDPKREVYNDGNSFMGNEQRKVRYAVVTVYTVIKSHVLPAGISAPKS